MVSISLRAYVNEINDLVDEHQIDEAIAHCRHILEHYPKHVDTYRMLGKAYLEEQRYGDAADIMQRVLSSVPEDFIAQVGMSIIREDEGNLDSAIYHMERAFETQPSNHAIQSELRRLNTKRDGIELTRVRLTRGALARMYAHGHLYDQAISELLAALSENPNRFDLQNLLAEMYYKTDKKVDAAETCTRILEKLPYCINANKLLTQILEESGRPEEAQRYRQRWMALDPYAKFVGEEFPLIDTVPDNHVSLEHLEYDPSSLYEMEKGQPAWATSLGLSLSEQGEETGEPIPDWLEDQAGDQFDDLRPTEMLPPEEADPFFNDQSAVMDGKRIGLIPQAETGDQVQSDDWLPDLDDAAQAAEPSSKEEDWLAALDTAEAGDLSDTDPSPFSLDDEQEADEWLTSLETPSKEPDLFTEDQEEEDWFASLETPDEGPEPSDQELLADQEDEDTDDWLASLEMPTEEPDLFTDDQEDDHDWLASLQEKTSDVFPSSKETAAADPDTELPDFLKQAGWQAGSRTADEYAPMDLNEEEELAAAEIPDWIKEMAPAEEEREEEDLTAEADPEWMKSLDAPASSPADWLKELEKETPETGTASGQEIEADDAGMAWLETLAAKQGIPDEELTTTAEQRAEISAEDLLPDISSDDIDSHDMPQLQPEPAEEESADTDWLQQIGKRDEILDEEELPEEPGDETPAWLESIQQDDASQADRGDDDTISRFLAAKAVLGADSAPPDETEADEPAIEDWLTEAAEPLEEPPQPASPVDEEADSFDSAWLDAIGAEAAQEAAEHQPASFKELLPAEDQLEEEPPQPASPVDEEADSFDTSWLDAIGAEAAQEAAEEQPGEDEWLAGIAQTSEAEDDEPGTDWLKAISQEAGEETAEEQPEKPEETPQEESSPSDLQAEPAGETMESFSPVDEEEDDFDMDWLDEISSEAAGQAAGEEAISPVDQHLEDLDIDWLDEISPQAAQEAPEEETALADEAPEADQWTPGLADETLQPVSPAEEDQEDLDVSWLEDIGTEAAQEAEEEKPEPVEESPAGEDWLAAIEQEDDLSQQDIISDTDAWLLSMEEASVEEQEEPEIEITGSDEWLTSLGVQLEEDQVEAEPTVPSEVKTPDEEFTEAQVEAEIQPTTAEEWQPESEIEPVDEAEPAPDPFAEKLEAARQQVQVGDLDGALKTFGALIKKGKLVEEIIQDLIEAATRHPINVNLWQMLGDAHLRLDQLQEALDAYSKAEDLLR
ncbi:MAG: tetratricopeptide repeat protein [Anaerolineales bacterium]|nr:tetratricopeptide repeat protein [Anaerolineales bacterium]